MAANAENMMYTSEVPWHGLGTYVGDSPTTSRDAITSAGLDWRVEKSPALALLGDGEAVVDAKGWFFNVRATDKTVLGCVQKGYNVLQNVEAFEFMDNLASKGSQIRYHTAGSLANGKRIWLLAKLEASFDVVRGDKTDPYILLVNGHDGRFPLRAMFTTVRVVCQNTLNLALEHSSNGMTIRHTGNMGEKIAEAHNVLAAATQEFDSYREVASYLARKEFGTAAFKSFLEATIPSIDLSERSTKRAQNVQQVIEELYESGPGSDIAGVTGSAWGALQAVTNYTAHHRPTRGAGKNKDKLREGRLSSIWFGSGNALNQKALSYLVDA